MPVIPVRLPQGADEQARTEYYVQAAARAKAIQDEPEKRSPDVISAMVIAEFPDLRVCIPINIIIRAVMPLPPG